MGVAVDWLGTKGGMEERLVPAAGVPLHTVRFGAPKAGMLSKLACLVRLVPAALSARTILRRLGAKVVLGMGGYPSLPGVFASLGWLARRLIHEQNVVPGLANRLLAPLSHNVLTSHRETFAGGRALVTGNPIRDEFGEVEDTEKRYAARKGDLSLLVLGGSQGARSLNEGVPSALARQKSRWRVEHAAGKSGVEATRKAYEVAGVEAEVGGYFDDACARMARADLVICRAGASTVAEVAAVGVASVLVPYPHAGSHQMANARSLEKDGAAMVVEDARLGTPSVLDGTLEGLASRERLLEMAVRARATSSPDAARKVALACEQELRHV